MSWGGLFISGATALAGIATDNEYLVGAGGAAGGSYEDSYKKMNESIIDEGRQQRLADSAYQRQQNLAQYQYDMKSGDREQTQTNLEEARTAQQGQWDATNKLNQTNADRLAETSALQNKVLQKELDNQNLSPEERAAKEIEYNELIAASTAKITANATEAKSASQLKALEKALADQGVPEPLIQEARLKAIFKQYGIGTEGKPLTAEVKGKFYTDAYNSYKEREPYLTDVEANSGQAEASAVLHAVGITKSLEARFGGGSGGGLMQRTLAGLPGGNNPIPTAADLAERINSGATTEKALLEKASTAEEKAIVEEAVKLATAPTSADSVSALTGRLDTEAKADTQTEIQNLYNNSPDDLSRRNATTQAQRAGVNIDTGEAVAFTPKQEKTINRYVDKYRATNAAGKSKLLKGLQGNAPKELLDEIIKRATQQGTAAPQGEMTQEFVTNTINAMPPEDKQQYSALPPAEKQSYMRFRFRKANQ
jgi:hypothetical protein